MKKLTSSVEAHMSDSLLDILSTPSVKAAQAANGSEAHHSSLGSKLRSSVFTAREAAFIETRDSFYMAPSLRADGRTCSIAADRPDFSACWTRRHSAFRISGAIVIYQRRQS